MTILAISEAQGVKNSIFDKNNFLHFCGPKFQNNVFEKETAKCTQFRFFFICINTKKFITLTNFSDLIPSTRGGCIIYHNSCPPSDTSIVCEKRNYKQLNFYQCQQLPFCYIHLSCDLQI